MCGGLASSQVYLTESVYKVVLQKSTPAQTRQLIFHPNNEKGHVDGFARELTFAHRLYTHFMCDESKQTVQ